MKKELEKHIENELTSLSANSRKIGSYLIKHQPQIKRIADVQALVNVSLSSVHRFVKAIGYPTFTHFLWDYNEYSNMLMHKSDANHKLVDDIARSFAKLTKGKKIYIITSRRAKSLGKFFLERLNDGGIPNLYYSESKMDITNFLRKTKNQVVLVFDVTGHSYLIERTNEILRSDFFQKKPPRCILISASSSRVIRNYKHHFSIGEIENKNYAIKN